MRYFLCFFAHVFCTLGIGLVLWDKDVIFTNLSSLQCQLPLTIRSNLTGWVCRHYTRCVNSCVFSHTTFVFWALTKHFGIKMSFSKIKGFYNMLIHKLTNLSSLQCQLSLNIRSNYTQWVFRHYTSCVSSHVFSHATFALWALA